MSLLARSLSRRRSSAMLLAGLLVCTLALATMLAYEAQNASRSHRAAAERALHDDAAVAAWELVTGVTDELQSTLSPVLGPITHTLAASPYELLPAPAAFASSAGNALRCPDAQGDSDRFYFLLDFRDGSLATTGAQPAPAVRAWLADTIGRHARRAYERDWSYAVLSGPPLVAYALKFAEHNTPIAAYGLATCPGALEPVIERVVAHRALLPAAVTGGATNDSVLTIVIRDGRGNAVYQSRRGDSSAYAADAPFAQLDGATARVSIRPRAVQLLVLGAPPGSRVPLLVGLLTLTAAMVTVTVTQLRREHELARLRADFISSVSHELRTPLSQILLFAETLSLGRVRTEQERRTATDVIVQEGRRLMHLVENILHFSRAERHIARLGPEPIDLSATVASIAEDWLPLAEAAGVRVQQRFACGVRAMADRRALRQMVLNLLDNAVKYGPPGQTITIGTSGDAESARVWVEDEGPGIPVRDRRRIWDAFYRLDRDANSAVAGSGIGLYVVRELARLHGGDARVEDVSRAGARFVIQLRTVTPDPVAPDEASEVVQA